MSWRGNIESQSPVFTGYHTFAPAGYIERYKEDAIFRFHGTLKGDPIKAATNFSPCFDTDEMLSISSHFKLFSQTLEKTLHKGSKDV